jgi:hypothetical protein
MRAVYTKTLMFRGAGSAGCEVRALHDDQRGSPDVTGLIIAALTCRVPHTPFWEQEKVKHNSWQK